MERKPSYLKTTSKGQITIPASIRKKLRLTDNDYLRARLEQDSIILEPVERKTDQDLVYQYAQKNS